MKAIGRLTKIMIGRETVRGTVAAQEYAVPVSTLDIDDKPEYIDNDSGFGDINEFNDSDINTNHAEGGYEGKVYDNVLGAELRATFGQAPVTTAVPGQTGVYQHDFSVANNNSHDSLTIFTKETGATGAFALAMIDTFKITAALDQFLTRSVAVQAKASAAYTPSAEPAYVRGNRFMAKNINVKQATSKAGLDAASALKLTAFEVEFAKNLDVQYVFGSVQPDDIQNQQFNVSGSMEKRKDSDDATWRTALLAGTPRAVRFEAINTAVTIGTSANPTLRVELPNVVYKENSRNRDNNAVTTESVSFQGNLSLADAASVTARLINTTPTY